MHIHPKPQCLGVQGYESSACSEDEDYEEGEEEDEVLALAKGVLRHKRVHRIHSGTPLVMYKSDAQRRGMTLCL